MKILHRNILMAMKSRNIITDEQDRALHQVLRHYIGSSITYISFEEDFLIFDTDLGQRGRLFKNDVGNLDIMIDNEIIGTIEKKVFDILVFPKQKYSIEEYINDLNILISDNIRYRSKVLISEIIKFLEEYILTSDFMPKSIINIDIYSIFNYNGIKMIYCLN